jgi:hypothetical protein
VAACEVHRQQENNKRIKTREVVRIEWCGAKVMPDYQLGRSEPTSINTGVHSVPTPFEAKPSDLSYALEPTMTRRVLDSTGLYTIGWIAALPIQLAAALAVLDERHEQPFDFQKPDDDDNLYSWGNIGPHNIVIVSLPAGMYGQISAATTSTNLARSIPVRFGLMVGIGGGIPRPGGNVDIRLGDVVVSQPESTHGGVAQYDVGKATAAGFELRGSLNSPPRALLNAIALLQAE